MNLYKTIFLAGTFSVLITSCADEAVWDTSSSSGEGKIKIILETSAEVSSEMPKFRSVSSEIITPSVSDFQIRMTNASGSYVKSWNSVEEFEKETEFRADTYTIEAFYGTENSQGIVKGEDKGHEYSYYYGKSDNIKIEPGKETNVQITTALANSVVVIEYSDAFKNYFKDWSTQLITLGESPLDLENNEGMAYVIPGDVDVVISATQQNGKTVKLNPAIFEAEARHLYKIMYNVYEGEIGQAERLQVIFNDMPDEEHTIEIELTDDLLSGDGPKITTEGFNSGDSLETVAGSPYDGTVKFNIDSPDGFNSVLLTIKSKDYYGSFLDNNGMVDLVTADASQRQAIESAGIKVLGIYDNPQRMAMIDLTEFCRYLNQGEYEFSLVVKDRMRSENAMVKMTALPLSVMAAPYGKAVLGRGYAEIILSYNGTDPTTGVNPFSFKAKNQLGFVESEILSVSQAPATRTIENKDYIFRISVPETMLDEYGVNVYINDNAVEIDSTVVPLDFPDYEVEYDPMSKKVMMRVTAVYDPQIKLDNVKDLFTNRLRPFVDDQEIKDLTKDNNERILTANGLQGGSTFTVKTSVEAATDASHFSDEKVLSYEKASPVPNGSFENTNNFINTSINQGGKYLSIANFGRYNTENYNINQPDNWANTNSKTCNYAETNVKNTWFLVPSISTVSGKSGQGVSLRSVGYNYNGTEPSQSGSVLSNTTYNTNSPEKGNTAAGKLFLGSYDIQISNYSISSESYNQGVSFGSRPYKLKGWYKYSPFGDDKGKATVEISGDGTVLATGEYNFESADDWTQFEIEFNTSYKFNKHPDSLKIMFMSSDKGSEDWNSENSNVQTRAITETTQKFLGSELMLDELEFEY